MFPQSVEGLREGRWCLLDYGTTIVHVFYDFVRMEYKLEDLWKDGKPLALPPRKTGTWRGLKIQLLTISSGRQPWLEDQFTEYKKKMAQFAQCRLDGTEGEEVTLQEFGEQKRRWSASALLQHLEPSALNVLLDGRGKTFASSEDFARELEDCRLQGQTR